MTEKETVETVEVETTVTETTPETKAEEPTVETVVEEPTTTIKDVGAAAWNLAKTTWSWKPVRIVTGAIAGIAVAAGLGYLLVNKSSEEAAYKAYIADADKNKLESGNERYVDTTAETTPETVNVETETEETE